MEMKKDWDPKQVEYYNFKNVYGVDDKAFNMFLDLMYLPSKDFHGEKGYDRYYKLDKYIWSTKQPTEILDDAAGSFYEPNFGDEILDRYERDGIDPYEDYDGYDF